MTITILDSVNPSAFGRLATTSTDALAGYDDGRFNDIGQIERNYPGHRHQAIAVFASDNGDWLDIETSDATPSQAPGWVRRQHARGLARPGLYANLSTMAAVERALAAAGVARNSVRLIVAHYDGIAQVPAGYDAKQYTDHWEGRNVDASVALDDFFDMASIAKPKKRPPAKKKVIHPKVKGATAGGISGVGVSVLLTALKVHVTPAEASSIATILAFLVGYVAPATAKPKT
jgi:hypothetical protein